MPTIERDDTILLDIVSRIRAIEFFDPVNLGRPEEVPIAASQGSYAAVWIYQENDEESLTDLAGADSLSDHTARFVVVIEVRDTDPLIRANRLARCKASVRNALIRQSLGGFSRAGLTRFETAFISPDVPERLPAVRTVATLVAVYSVKDREGRDVSDAEQGGW